MMAYNVTTTKYQYALYMYLVINVETQIVSFYIEYKNQAKRAIKSFACCWIVQ